ncbi:MAG: ThiF family adenylyltransferase, partial [Planctomycetia bacterium]
MSIANSSDSDGVDRYSRQSRFAPLGVEGQDRLRRGRAVVVGCGALGTVSANGLVRAGVGFVRIVDRDLPDITNLQRQVLFDESDVADAIPKAEAAVRKLRRVNSTVVVEGVVADVDPATIESLCGDVDVVVDGTDNFETRYLLNDFACLKKIPWVYG